MGVMASINETVDFETATLVANELGIETRAEEEIAPVAEEAAETVEPAVAEQVLWVVVDTTKRNASQRSITVLGHVDCGNARLLDVVHSSIVTSLEAVGAAQD